jgi:hypothetical protein
MFDPVRVVSTLHSHEVSFVIIGGIAAIAHGSALPTEDIDITPERSERNLERLAEALRELDARLRVDSEPDGVSFPVDARFFADATVLNLVTDAGDVDLVVQPAGFVHGYDDLVANAVVVDIGDGGTTLIAALTDVISSKQAAGRTKDIAALPHLRALEAEQRDRR